jgi:hypothetical protein
VESVLDDTTSQLEGCFLYQNEDFHKSPIVVLGMNQSHAMQQGEEFK